MHWHTEVTLLEPLCKLFFCCTITIFAKSLFNQMARLSITCNMQQQHAVAISPNSFTEYFLLFIAAPCYRIEPDPTLSNQSETLGMSCFAAATVCLV